MDPERVATQLERLSTTLEERERVADSFRAEIRYLFGGVHQEIRDHSAEDVRRFEKGDKNLEERIGELYAHLDATETERRKRAVQIVGVACAAAGSVLMILISAHKSGLL